MVIRRESAQYLERVADEEREDEVAAIAALMVAQGRSVRLELRGHRDGLLLLVWAVDDGAPFAELEELIDDCGFTALVWDGESDLRLYIEEEDEPWGLL